MSYRKRGGILTAIIIILIIALIVGMLAIFTSGFKNWDPSTWFKQTEETSDPTPEVPPVVDENGNAMDSETVYPMPQRMLFSPLTYDAAADTYSTYSVTVNATIEPADATNHGVNWSLAFKNPSSTWSTGKTITEYVTINSNGKTATVLCTQPFGEQIILTAASAENPEIKAMCTVDYVKPINEYIFSLGASNPDGNEYLRLQDFVQDSSSASFSLNSLNGNNLKASFGVGTVGGSINIDKLDVTFTDNITLDSANYPFNVTSPQKIVTDEWGQISSPVTIGFEMTADNYKLFYNTMKSLQARRFVRVFKFTYTLSSDYYGERTMTKDVWLNFSEFIAPYVSVTGITVDNGSLIIDSVQPPNGPGADN